MILFLSFFFFLSFCRPCIIKIKLHSICLKINEGKIRKKLVCISSCTLALPIRGLTFLRTGKCKVSLWFYGTFSVTFTRTHMHGHYSLFDFILFFFLSFFFVIPPFWTNIRARTRASSCPSLPPVFCLVRSVTSWWLGAVTALCLVGCLEHLEPNRSEDCVETKPAL